MVDGYLALGGSSSRSSTGASTPSCCYVGTAGCYLGMTRALRGASRPSGASPSSRPSRPSSAGGAPGTHRIEGGGVGFIPPQLPDGRGRRGRRRGDRRTRSRWLAEPPGGWDLVRSVDRGQPSPRPRPRLARARSASVEGLRGESPTRPGRSGRRYLRRRRVRLHRPTPRSLGIAPLDASPAGRAWPPSSGRCASRSPGSSTCTPRCRPRPAPSTGRCSACRCSRSSRSPNGGASGRCRAGTTVRGHRGDLLRRRPVVLAPRHRGGRGRAGHGPGQPPGHHRRRRRVAGPRGAAVTGDAARAARRAGRRRAHLGRHR